MEVTSLQQSPNEGRDSFALQCDYARNDTMCLVSELCSPIVPVARVCLLDQTASLVLLLVGGPFSMIQGGFQVSFLFSLYPSWCPHGAHNSDRSLPATNETLAVDQGAR